VGNTKNKIAGGKYNVNLDVFWLTENDAMIYELLNPGWKYEEKKSKKKSKENRKIKNKLINNQKNQT
jgi:hypothetical protein